MAKVWPNGAVVSNDDAWLWTGQDWRALAERPGSRPDRTQTDHARVLAQSYELADGVVAEAEGAVLAAGSPAGARRLLRERYPLEALPIQQSDDRGATWQDAPTPRTEVKIRSYNDTRDYQKDAERLTREGWLPTTQSATESHVSVSRTLAKGVLTGGLGLLLTGRSRSKGKIVVTWTRTT